MRAMYRFTQRMTGLRVLLACAVLLLAACNGNSNSTATLSGTAATGAALANATITVKDVAGVTATTTSDANGAYTVTLTGMIFPVIVQATQGPTTLYSWSFAAGTANITPLTTLALMTSPLPDNLGTVFSGWTNQAAAMTQQAMLNAQAVVNANLQTQFTAKSVPHTSYDFLKTAFNVNGAGIDGVLDLLDFVFDYANALFNIYLNGTNTAVSFVPNISIAGITIGGGNGGNSGGGGGGGGSSTLTCDTTQYQVGAVSTPTLSQVAAFAGTYNGQEGTYGPNFGDPFVVSGPAVFVLNANGTATYKGSTYTISSYCLDNLVSILYVMDAGGGHFDLFDNGDIYGYTASQFVVQPAP